MYVDNEEVYGTSLRKPGTLLQTTTCNATTDNYMQQFSSSLAHSAERYARPVIRVEAFQYDR